MKLASQVLDVVEKSAKGLPVEFPFQCFQFLLPCSCNIWHADVTLFS